MLNYETILSSYDDKMTLMQWLKKVEEALNGASLTNVELKKKGNATFAWSFKFENGTHIDTDYVTINEGESVAEAYLLNGHLMIKLTNDEVIDAGNLKPVTSFSFNSQRHLIVNYGDGTTQDLGLIKGVSSFTIDTNQHLIVNYDNGTTQDLGAIFSGNININGNLTANSIIENMSGYSYDLTYRTQGYTIENDYISVVKTGNKITFVESFNVTKHSGANPNLSLGRFAIPIDVLNKLFNQDIGTDRGLDARNLNAYTSIYESVSVPAMCFKPTGWQGIQLRIYASNLVEETKYFIRYEVTFLLSENMVGN